MATVLDAVPDELDPSQKNIIAQIRKHGWMGTYVMADEEGPSFSYTMGFWLKFSFPEVILFSVPREKAHDIFWAIYREIDEGRRLPIGVPVDGFIRNFQIVFLPVSVEQYREYLGQNRWFYDGDDFECLQLVFPDREGNFPWSSEASDEFRACQPDLTEGDWSGLCHSGDE